MGKAFEVALPEGGIVESEVVEGGEGAEGSDADANPETTVVPESVLEPLQIGLRIADRLAGDGHLRGGASAATLCSLAWLFWHIAALPTAVRASLLSSGDSDGAVAL